MLKFTTPLQSKDSLHKNRGDATITLILAIVLISGVFLTGGILPSMREDTLKKDTEAVVQGIRSEDSSGTSFIASSGTTNDAKKTLQMKQLILATVTPTPTGTPIPTPTRTPTPTQDPIWDISFQLTSCIRETSPIAAGLIAATGDENGYISLEIENGGIYTQIVSTQYLTSNLDYEVDLPSSVGYSSNNWRIRLFSGGSQLSGKWQGGTLKNTLNQEPTGC